MIPRKLFNIYHDETVIHSLVSAAVMDREFPALIPWRKYATIGATTRVNQIGHVSVKRIQ